LAVADEGLALEFDVVIGLPDGEDGGSVPCGGSRPVYPGGRVEVRYSVTVVVEKTLPRELEFVVENDTPDVEFVAVTGDPSVDEDEVGSDAESEYEPYL
ncbi:hypothetical protein LTR53_018324, partial [Teratosphaeriaceae sp. CCFEE 6253]